MWFFLISKRGYTVVCQTIMLLIVTLFLQCNNTEFLIVDCFFYARYDRQKIFVQNKETATKLIAAALKTVYICCYLLVTVSTTSILFGSDIV